MPSRVPALIWLAGTVWVLARVGAGRMLLWMRSRHALRETPVPEGVERLRVALGLGRVRVIRWRSFRGPVTFGVLRPTVALPMDFETRFEPRQASAILAHELAHLAGRDPLWRLVSDGVCALAWWHPAVWWARRQLHAACETVADAASGLVPGGRMALAESLVAFGGELTATGGTGAGGDGRPTELARRVRSLLAEDPGGWTRSPVGVWGVRLTAGVLACGFLGVPVATPFGVMPWRVFAGGPGAGAVATNQPVKIRAESTEERVARVGGITIQPQVASWTRSNADPRSVLVVESVPIAVPPVAESSTRLTLAPPSGVSTAYVPLSPSSGEAARPTGGTRSNSVPVAEPAEVQIAVQVRLIDMMSPSWGTIDWIFGAAGAGESIRGSNAPAPVPPEVAAVVGAGGRLEHLVAGARWATLSSSQMAAFLQQIQTGHRVGGIDLLAAPKVLTLSGRSARIAIGESINVATGPTTGSTPAPQQTYATYPLPVGVTVDMTPLKEADGFRIPTHVQTTEFRGYDEPAKGEKLTARGGNGRELKAVPALPRIRLRDVEANPSCRPGEVIVLRGPNTTNVIRTVDRVVVLGSVPLLGRLFTTKTTQTNVTRLYVVLEPVEVDAAGRAVNSPGAGGGVEGGVRSAP
jgi:hypothetical protein